MRQVKLLGVAFVAIFALAAALSTAASAKPIMILPESATERTWKGETDEANPILEGLFGKVTCEKATAEGTEEAHGKPLGLFHITFKGCKSGASPCEGTGDPKEVILSLGTWHLVYDQILPSTLLVATLFLPELTTFKCGVLTLEVKGELLCLDLEAAVELTSHLFHCHQKEALQLEKTYWTDETEKEVTGAQLLCRLNMVGGFTHCAELALGLVKHERALFADF